LIKQRFPFIFVFSYFFDFIFLFFLISLISFFCFSYFFGFIFVFSYFFDFISLIYFKAVLNWKKVNSECNSKAYATVFNIKIKKHKNKKMINVSHLS